MRTIYSLLIEQLFLHDSGGASYHLANRQWLCRQILAIICSILVCLLMLVEMFAKIVVMGFSNATAFTGALFIGILPYDAIKHPRSMEAIFRVGLSTSRCVVQSLLVGLSSVGVHLNADAGGMSKMPCYVYDN